MIWEKSLEIVIQRTGHERFRWLCSEENPDEGSREGYRRIVIEMASKEPPGMIQKAINFASAVAHHVAAGLPRLSEDETAARLAVCQGCPQFHDRTCALCGCNMRIKASWAEQDCPLGKWPKLERKTDELALGPIGSDFESESPVPDSSSTATP